MDVRQSGRARASGIMSDAAWIVGAVVVGLVAAALALTRAPAPHPAVVPVERALAQLRAEQASARKAQPLAMVALAPQPLSPTAIPKAARVFTASTPARTALRAADPCAVLRDRDRRLGETVSFRGEYHVDAQGRALVRPLGCDQAIVLSDISPVARRLIDETDPSLPHGRFVARFDATLVGALPRGVAASDEPAVRLSITAVADLQRVDP